MSVCNLFRKSIVKERRRSPRVRLHGEVHLQISGLSLRIPAADISVSGVGVLLDEYVLAGKPSGEMGSGGSLTLWSPSNRAGGHGF